MEVTAELIFKALAFVIYLICTNFLVVNVYVTFTTFLSGETIETTTKKVPFDEEIQIPSVAVCLKNPFKDVNKRMYTLEEYDKNSRLENDTHTKVNVSNTFKPVDGLITWKMEYINTLPFGKCLLYEIKQKVSE